MAPAASIEPTLRSMPPVMMIMVMPIAIMPMVEILRKRLKIFWLVKK